MANLIHNSKEKFLYLWRNGAFHILGGSFLNKFISMFASIIIVRILSKNDYGLLSYTENIYNYAFIFAGIGLSNSILRFVVLEDKISKKKGYFNFSIKYGLIVNIAIVTFAIILNTIMEPNIEFASAKGLLYLYILILPFQHFLDDFLILERAMFSNSRYAYFSFAILCLLLLGRIFGAYLGGVLGVIIFILIIYIISSIYFYINIRKKYFENVKEELLTREEKKETIIYAVQYMITNGLWTIFSLNGTFLLGQFSNSKEVIADFKVAMVLPGCLSIVSSAIGTYIAPYFIKNENSNTWILKNYLKTIAITLSVLTSLALICFVFEKFIVTLIYGERYLSVLPVMNLLLISAVINGAIRYTTANIFAAMGLIKYNLITSVIGICCQFLFSYLLVPHFKSIGTAYTEIIVYSIMSLFLVIFFLYKFKFKGGK